MQPGVLGTRRVTEATPGKGSRERGHSAWEGQAPLRRGLRAVVMEGSETRCWGFGGGSGGSWLEVSCEDGGGFGANHLVQDGAETPGLP